MKSLKQYVSNKKLRLLTLLYGVTGGWFLTFLMYCSALGVFHYENTLRPIEAKVSVAITVLLLGLLVLLFIYTFRNYKKDKTLADNKKTLRRTYFYMFFFGLLLSAVLYCLFIPILISLAEMNLFSRFFHIFIVIS